jgi:uncharacterized protein (UPF0276 family)
MRRMRQLNDTEGAPERDRFGLGYRPELALSIVAHLDRIDVIEVIAESLLHAGRRERAAMRTLARQVEVLAHGVSLGLCSAAAVSEPHLDAVARVLGELQPRVFSEHLAFVRAGGRELGHLAMPPRRPETIDGTLENVARARAVLGTIPLLENVATLLDPPGSTLDELQFVSAVLEGAGAELLLDLHNLHANAYNLGYDAVTVLRRLPLERVRIVHLAGGKPLRDRDGRVRLLDDHLHAVEDPVLELLEELGCWAPGPLRVIVERDGRYPPMAELLRELDAARDALARGRARRKEAA